MTDSSGTAETKTRLLDAAEHLFAEQGFATTSTRQLTAAAEANLAAVNYHFGSKGDLLRAVFERRLVPINDERSAALEALERELGPSRAPDLHRLLHTFLEPALRLAREPHGQRFLRLLGRLHAEPDRSPARELFETQFERSVARLMPLLNRALPEMPADTLRWRLFFSVGAMAHTMMCSEGLEHLFLGEARDTEGAAPDPDVVLARLVEFVAAGLAGPIASSNGGVCR